ncbi:GatB YqeY domain-containing protein [Hygrophoropsis aurantiaca]|uniref:GatB YqeY domain-containing protein n=1 Tax=Hygrophoropsis aurantiaca TaxID=72124 RepID=A0ACB8AQB7_9AGAM|nr:GatB YqeY domain-containing protein [Hygrophoropsis aurantiaca]
MSYSDIRERLMSGVKTAMKNKDSVTSTTLRSALSEVYAADKTTASKATPSAIISILRKAAARRNDSAAQFIKASRPDLAEKERREADILSAFLPPLLSESDIDRVLKEVLVEQSITGDPRKALGMVFKSFYSKVDKSSVDTDIVKKRAEALLASKS